MASRASSSRARARAWLTCPSMSGSDQRSWTVWSCRTSGQVGGVLGPPARTLGVSRGAVAGALLRLGRDLLGGDLLHAAAGDFFLLGQELRSGPDVVLGDVGQG